MERVQSAVYVCVWGGGGGGVEMRECTVFPREWENFYPLVVR